MDSGAYSRNRLAFMLIRWPRVTRNPGPVFDPELRPKGEPGFGSPLWGGAYRTGVWEGHACLFKAVSHKEIPSRYCETTSLNSDLGPKDLVSRIE